MDITRAQVNDYFQISHVKSVTDNWYELRWPIMATVFELTDLGIDN